ncbi:ACP phosphodiesterase [Massilia sp. BJB1822]|uniref:acyl carrier protein phosphodiesterase n=1 Tax=Massilia sp. BJB1822 TaxID=2744470 RepID=UPI001593F797|nr:ACP phosphodiesterase [Massilia sp. BJB1822]NVD96530.1 DUF479 domain-containing protein [Massilia sp. BJB1822]
MNYLAHIYLARHSDDAMVGALLGDFVKINAQAMYPAEVVREIQLHRYIDSYTDSHPIVRSAVQLFGEGRRRYAGIVLDVFYDHLLSRRWAEYSNAPKEELIQRFYQAVAQYEPLLPERLRAILPHMVAQDWLGSYEDLTSVELAVQRISQRLSRNGHLMREGLLDVREHYDVLAAGFDQFFPQLIRFAEQKRGTILSHMPEVHGIRPANPAFAEAASRLELPKLPN